MEPTQQPAPAAGTPAPPPAAAAAQPPTASSAPAPDPTASSSDIHLPLTTQAWVAPNRIGFNFLKVKAGLLHFDGKSLEFRLDSGEMLFSYPADQIREAQFHHAGWVTIRTTAGNVYQVAFYDPAASYRTNLMLLGARNVAAGYLEATYLKASAIADMWQHQITPCLHVTGHARRHSFPYIGFGIYMLIAIPVLAFVITGINSQYAPKNALISEIKQHQVSTSAPATFTGQNSDNTWYLKYSFTTASGVVVQANPNNALNTEIYNGSARDAISNSDFNVLSKAGRGDIQIAYDSTDPANNTTAYLLNHQNKPVSLLDSIIWWIVLGLCGIIYLWLYDPSMVVALFHRRSNARPAGSSAIPGNAQPS